MAHPLNFIILQLSIWICRPTNFWIRTAYPDIYKFFKKYPLWIFYYGEIIKINSLTHNIQILTTFVSHLIHILLINLLYFYKLSSLLLIAFIIYFFFLNNFRCYITNKNINLNNKFIVLFFLFEFVVIAAIKSKIEITFSIKRCEERDSKRKYKNIKNNKRLRNQMCVQNQYRRLL
jgi:hypothetical protein